MAIDPRIRRLLTREEIASVVDWSERQSYADGPVIAALRH
jgi:hypothetical protein